MSNLKLGVIVMGKCELRCESKHEPSLPNRTRPDVSFLPSSHIMGCLTSLSTSVCVHQAEARLAAKRAARAEAREIRMRELERQQKEVKTLQMFVTRVVASSTTAVHN